ncbi:MAG: hypothetical protein RJB66_1695 [Pseudomonadota bacterium]
MKTDFTKRLPNLVLKTGTPSVLLLLTLIIFRSLNDSVNIPTFHLDGAFQTASGLFRLNAGQFPGRDFLPYLGIGPIFSIYPVFKLAGANLAASVFSAKFTTLVFGWFAISVLWQLIFQPRNRNSSLIAGGYIFFAPFLIGLLAFATQPGNSLKPIRSVIPYLVAGASMYINKRYQNPLRPILLGFIIGAALLWSNDFAIPTATLFLVFFVGYFYFVDKTTWKKSISWLLLTTILSWILMITLATAGHPMELLKYNFIDVARAQWWYFGPYAPASRIFEFGHLLKLVSPETYFPLCVLIISALVAIKTKTTEYFLLAGIGLVLFFGGVLPSVGGHLGDYFGAFNFWGVATAIVACLKGIEYLLIKDLVPKIRNLDRFKRGLITCLFCYLLLGVIGEIYRYEKKVSIAKYDTSRFYVKELGGYLNNKWVDYINYARENKHGKVIEEYWGLFSALNSSLPAWPVDSVIHALGNTREPAKVAINVADVVVTTRFVAARDAQPWSLSQNFWFYEELLAKWVPIFISPTTVVWQKGQGASKATAVKCNVLGGKNSLELQAGDEGFYMVKFNYSTSGEGRYLLMFRNNISFAADADGYVSLPPEPSTTTIPVLITKASGKVLDSKIIGGAEINFTIESCVAEKLAFDNAEVIPRK